MINPLTAAGEAKSVGLLGQCCDLFPRVWGQARDPPRYRHRRRQARMPDQRLPLPQGWDHAQGREKAARARRKEVEKSARAQMKSHVFCDGNGFLDAGRAPTLDSRQPTFPSGRTGGRAEDALCFPGFVPAYIRPLFCLGRGIAPFRWPASVREIRRYLQNRTAKVKEKSLSEDNTCNNWLTWPRADRLPRVACPQSAGWVWAVRDKLGPRVQPRMVAYGELKAGRL